MAYLFLYTHLQVVITCICLAVFICSSVFFLCGFIYVCLFVDYTFYLVDFDLVSVCVFFSRVLFLTAINIFILCEPQPKQQQIRNEPCLINADALKPNEKCMMCASVYACVCVCVSPQQFYCSLSRSICGYRNMCETIRQ